MLYHPEAFAEKTVLVTGASRGIGAATARAFASAGARVAVNYRTGEEEAEELRAELDRRGGGGGAYRCDVRDDGAVAEMVEGVRSDLGPVDVLVNNAGVTVPRQIGELDGEAWDRVLDTNLTGAFRLVRAVVPGMRDRGAGAVVNVSSIAAQTGTVDAAYAASKAGLLGLTRALARELGPYGIRVNAIAPGPVETELGEEVLEFLERTDFHGHGDLGTFLERYAASPEEVAEGILYLAAAEFVTGEVLTLNGGMYTD